MHIRARFPAALVGLGVLLFAWVAEAQRVALVRPLETDSAPLEVFNRVSAELRIQDFEVAIQDTGALRDQLLELRAADPRANEALAEIARRTSAVATVRFPKRADSTAVDVWLGPRAGGRAPVQTIEPPGGLDAPNVLAIRTVDLLRTTLREFGGGERPPPPAPLPENKPAPPAPPPPPPRPPNWKIHAEGVAIWDRPTLGLALGAGLGVTRRLSDRFEIGLAVAGPIVLVRNWGTPAGSASVRHEMGWAELRWGGWSAGPFVVGLSGGVGAFRFEVQGLNPREFYLANNGQVWSFATTLAGHAEIPLGGNAAIGFTLRAIGLTPRPAVGVGESQAVVQFPLLGASAGLLVAF
ncbi:MAG: hypothetical protein ABW133_14420 [Polyangiaceae bacterium]